VRHVAWHLAHRLSAAARSRTDNSDYSLLRKAMLKPSLNKTIVSAAPEAASASVPEHANVRVQVTRTDNRAREPGNSQGVRKTIRRRDRSPESFLPGGRRALRPRGCGRRSSKRMLCATRNVCGLRAGCRGFPPTASGGTLDPPRTLDLGVGDRRKCPWRAHGGALAGHIPDRYSRSPTGSG
jgi:hypothetical protein